MMESLNEIIGEVRHNLLQLEEKLHYFSDMPEMVYSPNGPSRNDISRIFAEHAIIAREWACDSERKGNEEQIFLNELNNYYSLSEKGETQLRYLLKDIRDYVARQFDFDFNSSRNSLEKGKSAHSGVRNITGFLGAFAGGISSGFFAKPELYSIGIVLAICGGTFFAYAAKKQYELHNLNKMSKQIESKAAMLEKAKNTIKNLSLEEVAGILSEKKNEIMGSW